MRPLLDEDALRGDAHLPREVRGALHGRGGGCGQVGVGQHDLRPVARRLDQGALHPSGANDGLAGTVRPDEADRVDAGMRHERLARLSGAVHDADRAGGQPASSRIATRLRPESGVNSLGFRMTAFPVASAGAIAPTGSSSGSSTA